MIETGTDKASVWPQGMPRDYARFYDEICTPFRKKPSKLLEIGVRTGESVKAWLEYFPCALIFGIDNDKTQDEWRTPGAKGRYFFSCADASDYAFWQSFFADHGKDFDIIIDDGSHRASDVIATHKHLWGAVKSGGYYVIEDLEYCYYKNSNHFVPRPGQTDQMQYLKTFIDQLNNDSDIDYMWFVRQMVIIKKK